MRLVAVVALLLTAAFLFSFPRQAQSPPSEPVPMQLGGYAARITLGAQDAQPADWDAEITISEGGVDVTDETPAPAAERPRRAARRARGRERAAQRPARSRRLGQGPNQRMQPAVLMAHFDAPQSAEVRVQTKRGDFSFKLADLRYGSALTFLEGAAVVERVPVTQQITSAAADDDFPACTTADGETVWCAYVEYQHGTPINTEEVNTGKFDSLITQEHGDQIKLLKFDGKQWTGPMDVTATKLDVWRPTIAVDGKGHVWIAWSQGAAGEWDVYARSYDPKSSAWAAVQRITSDPGADINVVATRSRSGNVWIAWMKWHNSDFGIVAQPLRGSSGTLLAGRDARRSRNFLGANEWNPSIAADSRGGIHVAFDTYNAGNYDTYVWTLNENKPGDGDLVPVATSPRFEARPSIAVDASNRVWVAYEDAAANWGKDFGSRWEAKSGVPFYLDRNIVVRSVSGGQLQQTRGEIKADAITTMYPPSDRKRISFPRLAVASDGRPWLLFRQHPLRTGMGERWMSYAASYDGDAWSEPVLLPSSENALDNRPAFVSLKDGVMLAVYASDDRPAGNASARENDLHAAAIGDDGLPAKPPVFSAAQARGNEPDDPVHPNERDEIKRILSHRVAAGGKSYQPLRGEFHRHTEISSHRDQDGPLEEIWRYGLDVARMDWIGPGDHDFGAGREYTWWLIQKQVEMYFHAPVFMPMFTHERSVVYPSGHRNVIFTKRGVRALPRLATPQQPELLFGTEEGGSPDIKNLYAYLKHFSAICSSHTSATSMGTDWRDNDPDVEPVVEIYQGHRQNYEEPKAPYSARDAQDSIGGYEPKGYVWNAFAKGYKLGFQISSDHVSTHISYAIVWAERPTREAIVDAFRKRHSYGAHDNIILDVRSGDHMMGDEFAVSGAPKLDINVIGTAPVERVDIVRQVAKARPEYVYSTEPSQQNVKLSWTDSAARTGSHMYYVRIRQSDGKMAWASPMWINVR